MNTEKSLHPNVIPYWKTRQMISGLVSTVILFIPIGVHSLWLQTWDWLLYVSLVLITIVIGRSLFIIFYGVKIKYSRHGYSLTNDEITIRSGNVWMDSSSIIPMSRIQHVDKEQDILAKRYSLSELVLHTAGDAHSIIGLLDEEAEQLRYQVIKYAKIGDTDAYYD